MVEPLLPGVSLQQGPSCWQLLQQDQAGQASLALSGRFRVDAPVICLEARLVAERDGAPVVDWQPLTALDSERWEGRLDGIPRGGLYRLETRATRAGTPDIRPTRGDYVHHLGVGDLWVIAGQSNASGTGLGRVEDPPTLGVHLFGNDECWQLATHPLEDATNTLHPITVHGVFQGHSPWLAFARTLLQRLGHPIGLIPTALGGSPLAMWDPAGGVLYDNLVQMVDRAGGHVRGVVWYQGESDCSSGLAETYLERFARFVEGLRRDLGEPSLPILTAQLGRYTGPATPEQEASWTRLREAQRQAALTLPGVYLIPAVDLPMSDEIHVSAAGNVALGERFAATALRHLYGLPLPEPALHFASLAWQADSPPMLRVRFDRPPAGWCRPGVLRDFRVADGEGEVPIVACAVDDAGWVDLTLARRPGARAMLHAHPGCDPSYDLRDRDQRPVVAFSVAVP